MACTLRLDRASTVWCPAQQADGRELSGRELAVVPQKASAQGDAGSDGEEGGAFSTAPAQIPLRLEFELPQEGDTSWPGATGS